MSDTNCREVTKKHLSITVDEVVFTEIEKRRGLVARAVFVNEKLKEILGI